MSSDAEILSPQAAADGAEAADPRRWAALVVMLLAAGRGAAGGLAFLLMLALPARRGHNAAAATV